MPIALYIKWKGEKMRRLLINIIILIIIAPSLTWANGLILDFGWGPPQQNILYPKISKNDDIEWSYKITNSNDKLICAQIKIVVVTDTGQQYEDHASLVQNGKISPYIKRVSNTKGDIYPGVTKHGIAIFDSVDKEATMLNFFVSGLIINSPDQCEQGKGIFRITYKKAGKGWNLVKTDWME